MKKRNREISIFSMSALDLFASALGAFILIAVVLFPFFPNVSPGPDQLQKQLAQAQSQLAQAEQQLDKAQQELEKSQSELAKIKIPDIDLVIALDITGSMGDEIAGLKAQIDELTEVLDKLAPTVGIGIIAFGDREYDRPLTVQDILEITASASVMRQLQNFVKNIKYGMGRDPTRTEIDREKNPDGPEAIDLALQRGLSMAWRSKATRRYIVIITDQPAYPEKVKDTYQMTRQFAATAGNSISTVLGSASTDIDTSDYLRKLADAGNGKFINTGSILSAMLTAILK